MKSQKIIAALFALSAAAYAEPHTYTVDPIHSTVGFQARHLVSKSNGTFNKFTGKIVFDEKKPETSSAEGEIEIASVSTNNADRDKHLQGADFFKADKHPKMTFKSTKWKALGKSGKHEVTGDLTFAGVTKPVTLELTYAGEAPHPMMKGVTAAGFSATATIKRSDWGLGYGIPMVRDEVVISVEVEAHRGQPVK